MLELEVKLVEARRCEMEMGMATGKPREEKYGQGVPVCSDGLVLLGAGILV